MNKISGKVFCVFIFLMTVSVLGGENIFFEAEGMSVSGRGWYARDHFGGWYSGVPSGGRLLAGFRKGDDSASKEITVSKAGEYNVWIRYIDLKMNRKNIAFKISVIQGDKKYEKVFDDSEKGKRATPAGARKWGGGYGRFVWDSMKVPLVLGKALVVVSKCHPKTTTTALARLLDCIVVSPDLNYTPKISDFFKPLYLKVIMGASNETPAVLHIFGRHPRSPWYTGHYNINAEALVRGANKGVGNKVAIKPGGSSPWVDIAPMLSPIGLNKLAFRACVSYTKNLSYADFTLLFSNTKSKDGLIKSFHREGRGCGMLVGIDLTKREAISDGLLESAGDLRRAEAAPGVPGRRPEKFPFGTALALTPTFNQNKVLENELKALSTIGLNYLKTDAATAATKSFDKYGFKKFSNSYFYFHKVESPSCLSAPKTKSVVAEINKRMEKIESLGVSDKLLFMNLMDEPSFAIKHMLKCELCRRKFISYLRMLKVSAADLGIANLNDARFQFDAEKNPALFYYSMRYRSHAMAEFFKIGTDAVEKNNPSVPTIANFSNESVYNVIHRGADWFEILNSGSLTMGWTEDWLNWTKTYQLSATQGDLMRAACEKNHYKFGIYNILAGRSPWAIVAKGFTEVGHGFKVMHFFNYGPHYALASDANSANPAIYAPIKRLAYAVGAAEDQILTAKVARGDVAMLYSSTSDIWGFLKGTFSNTNGLERTYLNLLLRHSGYMVDFLSEDDVIGGKLKNYKILFATGAHLRKSVANSLERWVRGGGYLCVDAGALRFDEFNRPLGLLRKLGCEPGEFNYAQPAGRPPYELPRRKPLGEVVWGKNAFSIVCVRGTLVGGEPLARFKDGALAATRSEAGTGSIVSLGFLPALSYLREAILKDRVLKKDKKKRRFYSCRWYPEGERSLIKKIVSTVGVTPKISTSNYLVDASVLESSKYVVIALANWTGEPLKNLRVELRGFNAFKSARNVAGESLKLSAENNSVSFNIDLSEGDFIICGK